MEGRHRAIAVRNLPVLVYRLLDPKSAAVGIAAVVVSNVNPLISSGIISLGKAGLVIIAYEERLVGYLNDLE